MYTPNPQSLILFLSVYHILLNFIATPVLSQPAFTACVCQDTFGNYTQNSTFKQNLNTLLSTITSDTKIDNGFYNFSVGRNLDIVNGIGLCDMDISLSDCKTCLSNAADAIVEECPTQRDAIGWYDHCMLRYSNRYIFRKLEFGPWFHMQSVSYCDTNKYNQTALTLLTKLQEEAASGDSGRKFAAAQSKVSDSCTIHALVQGTPDLDYSDCYQCLEQAFYYPLLYYPGQNARVSYTSCKIRYENYLFYNEEYLDSLKPQSSPLPSPSSVSPSSVHKKGKKGRRSRHIIIILLSVTSVSFLFLTGLVSWYLWRKRGTNETTIKDPGSLKMEFNTIKTATGKFSIVNKLGQGGFGIVYKGRLPNGQAIAVKRLSNTSDHSGDEFKNEAVLVARLRHRNLVRFLGYCLEGQERLLIYELLPNKSLDYFLFDTIKRGYLDWQTRYKIIGGIARGLVYLHEESQLLVVHRDLKAGNILLDAEMNPKISDFGMARLFGVDQTHEDTRKICGTFGYMPPEYVQQGHFSFKSDVYSFGVLLIEIISGLRVTQYHHEDTGEGLLSYAWRNWLESTPLNIVDTTMSIVNTIEVLRCINIGLICVQENIAHRPLMSSVVLMLNNHNIDLTIPSRPAFLVLKNDELEKSSNEGTLNEISVSELDPR